MLLSSQHPAPRRFSPVRLLRFAYSRSCTLLLISLSVSLYAANTYAGQLAIVIDDIGYRAADHKVMRLPLPVTVAVLPSAPHAANMAKQAAQQGRETIIHLPMQPRGNQRVEAGALHTGMGAGEVQHTLQQAIRIVPNAIGLNNHMGSAATSDPVLMKLLMQQLKTRRLLFLDSLTINTSVAESTARELGVPALRRTVFLDDDNSLTRVQAEFQRAVKMAQHKGWAIAIGHPRPNTIKVLQAGLAGLPHNVQLVPLSTLVYAKSNISLTSPAEKPHSKKSGSNTASSSSATGLYQPGPIIEQPNDKSPVEKSPTHTTPAESKPHTPTRGNHTSTSAILSTGSESLTTPPEPLITFEVLGMSESPDINQLDLLPAATSKPPYIKLPLMRGQRED
ncbi:MAG: divergent polysaccharide deacetylase family protein [Plesiomonas sp.]